jgi:K+-transporting ATPase ATPase A chain
VTEKVTTNEQSIAVGPVASQVAIKQLGTNGGGFFNVNSAHPLENPTPLSNLLEMLAILIIPAALCVTFGIYIKDQPSGPGHPGGDDHCPGALMGLCVAAEQAGNPLFERLGLATQASDLQAGGNMEGKEARFGVVNSALWATATTAASNGSVNAMHDSFTPLGGLVPMWLMQLGEVIFGGVGSGLYGMIIFALVAVFVAGLMIGRTPEYLGKKIEAFEVKMAAVAILVPPLVVLVGTAVAVMLDAGRAGIANPGAHGFSEILYAFSSAGNNNGSAFAGLSANTPFYKYAAGLRHALRALLDHRAGTGHRRLAGRQEAHSARCRHAADPYPAVRPSADRHGDRRRRPDFPAGPGARPDRRTTANAWRALRKIRMQTVHTLYNAAICGKPPGNPASAYRRAIRSGTR